jgi:hypothetical protein
MFHVFLNHGIIPYSLQTTDDKLYTTAQHSFSCRTVNIRTHVLYNLEMFYTYFLLPQQWVRERAAVFWYT